MIQLLAVGAVAVVGVGLVAAAPASAAGPTSHGAGYVAAPPVLHKAAVTVIVPTLTCGSRTATRTLQAGLFATSRTHSGTRSTALFVRARCTDGSTSYRAEYRGTSHFAMHVRRGDRVRLVRSGATGLEIDDLTAGHGTGGGSSSSATLTPRLLVGVDTSRPAPKDCHVQFRRSKVNDEALSRASRITGSAAAMTCR